jgi:hypothetical protein
MLAGTGIFKGDAMSKPLTWHDENGRRIVPANSRVRSDF